MKILAFVLIITFVIDLSHGNGHLSKHMKDANHDHSDKSKKCNHEEHELGPQPPVPDDEFDSSLDGDINSKYGYRAVPCSLHFYNYTAPVSISSGIVGEKFRWRNGFYAHPDPRFTAQELRMVNSALYEISKHLCVGVRVWAQNSNPTGDYAFIQKGDYNSGCWSLVGRRGGRQVINLQINGCMDKATIMHEIIHALGFYHEHNRPDRDQHINIFWANIQQGYEYAFNVARGTSTLGLPYDFYSIMHYWSESFSKNGRPTMLKKNGQRIGRNTGLSRYDIQKLRLLYNCQ